MKPARELRSEAILCKLTKAERRLVERVIAWENEGRRKHRLKPLNISDMMRALFIQRARQVGVLEEGPTPDQERRIHATKMELARRAKRREAMPPCDRVVLMKSEMSFFAEWEAVIKEAFPAISREAVIAGGSDWAEGGADEVSDEEGTDASDEEGPEG